MMLHNLIEDYIATELTEDLGDLSWAVSARSGDGNWCLVSSYKSRIVLTLNIEEDKLYAQLAHSPYGFSGEIRCDKLCMPNSHLFTQFGQLETIIHFLPKDNINDHYHKVVEEYVMERRKQRKLEREHARLLSAIRDDAENK